MIRRLETADCAALSPWLDAQFAADPASGGVVGPSAEKLESQVNKGLLTWVAEDKGITGVLGPAIFGEWVNLKHEKRSYVLFGRLMVDKAIYDKSEQQAAELARDLTIAAADDIEASGLTPDDILVRGPVDSRGGHWAERLGMNLITETGRSALWQLDFKDIWERAKAAV